MSTRECSHSVKEAWLDHDHEPERPEGSLQWQLGSPGQHSSGTWLRPTENLDLASSSKKMCISRVLSERTMGRLEPEHRLTYSHCRRKGEKLGEGGGGGNKKTGGVGGEKGRVFYGFFPFFFLFFHFFPPAAVSLLEI